MSKDFYRSTIKPGVERIKAEKNTGNDGLAFQEWLVELFCEKDQDIDRSEAKVFAAKDGGVDIMLFSPNQEHIYVIQAKYTGVNKAVARDDIVKFKKLRDDITPQWIQGSDISEDAADGFNDYLQYTRAGWNASWLFITTGVVPESAGNLEEAQFEVYGTSEIKKIHTEAKAQVQPPPDKVEFSVAGGMKFHFDSPRKTLIAMVKGNELRNLYGQHRDSLLAYNVRTFMGMGRNSINKDIIDTAQESGDRFFYYNNGISAICHDFTLKGSKVIADKFQIINGGQTIGSIWRAGNTDDVNVLVKLCVGDGMGTDSGFNHSIITYNNTQNVIKDSDFRANDPIQSHIKQRFGDLKCKGALKKPVDYRPKRGGKKTKAGHRALKLEDLAKIRYAYRHDPCHPIEKPKLLWDADLPVGKYREAFGEIKGVWSDGEFNEAVFALVLFDRIEDTIKRLNKAEDDEDSRINSRLRYHILGLARLYAEHKDVSMKIWEHKEKFEDFFTQFWDNQITFVTNFEASAKGKDVARGALSNLLRNAAAWEKLKQTFEKSLKRKIGG